MPPTHLTSVDFPAPLSPTSAVTSPAYTVKSTSRRTCTAPKLLLIPRSSSRGVALTGSSSDVPVPVPRGWAWHRDRRRTALADPGRAALGGVRPGAQLILGHVAVGHHVL